MIGTREITSDSRLLSEELRGMAVRRSDLLDSHTRRGLCTFCAVEKSSARAEDSKQWEELLRA